jgi:hypothetical protein
VIDRKYKKFKKESTRFFENCGSGPEMAWGLCQPLKRIKSVGSIPQAFRRIRNKLKKYCALRFVSSTLFEKE